MQLLPALRLPFCLLLLASVSRAAGLGPCTQKGLEGAECGLVRVPEDRATPDGRALDLFVLRLPALGPGPAQGVVFFLAGGPGEAASETVADLPGALEALRPRYDLVFLDQRGTGRSHALSCPAPSPGRELGEISPAEARSCREILEGRADLRRYTTWDAVADLESVRLALGYGRIVLFGASYGTQVSQAYIRRHPERVQAAVLVGAFPLAPESSLFIPRDAERALGLLLQDCAADTACAKAFPRLSQETAAVLKRLAAEPVRVTVEDPVTAKPRQVTLDQPTFARTLRTRLYSAEAAARVPLALHEAFTGDYRSMARAALAIAHAQKRNESLGMFLSVICSEWAPFLDAESVRRLASGTFFGPERTLAWLEACREWPRGDLPADFAAPVRADLPVLLLSGRLDPATPPYWGEQVAAFLPNARQVVFPASSHFPEGGCASALVARFLDQGHAAGLDTRCAETETRPPFALPTGLEASP
ncbi:MAG TPA: alpha/beta fold hydrolase [Thermoanaerobaculia bacterium]|jgi:pimeloyl-ACP methyl ester carboxylesterase